MCRKVEARRGGSRFNGSNLIFEFGLADAAIVLPTAVAKCGLRCIFQGKNQKTHAEIGTWQSDKEGQGRLPLLPSCLSPAGGIALSLVLCSRPPSGSHPIDSSLVCPLHGRKSMDMGRCCKEWPPDGVLKLWVFAHMRASGLPSTENARDTTRL